MTSIRVGQDAPDEPSAFLVANKEDLDRGEKNGLAHIEYVDGRRSADMPLQQFYKFGEWYDYTGEQP
jgi:hypothetical protein